LFRPDRVRFERDINLRYSVDGSEGRLNNHFEHYSFRKGLPLWWEKHNTYSTMEAREAMKVLGNRLDWRGLLSSNDLRRRAALKDLSFRVPFRSFWIFVYLMVVRLGVLDGPPGWTYCRMRAYYEFLITAKVQELQRLQRGEQPG
jgi:hypothetical protein